MTNNKLERKEFLIKIWEKGIKPIIIIVVIYFFGKSIYNVFTQNGTERILAIIFFSLSLLIFTITFLGRFLVSIQNKLNPLIPESFQFWLRVIKKILNYISPIIIGVVISHYWKKDWLGISLLLGIFLIQKIIDFITEEKQKTRQLKE